MTAPGTVPIARSASGLGSGLRPSAAWSLNPLGSFNSPPMKAALPATPPSHLRARGSPTSGPEKRPYYYAAPEAGAAEGADRLRRSPFFPAPRPVALYGAQGAPRAPLNSPGEQPQNPRKQAEIRVFHTVETFFPLSLVVNANETLFYPADDRSAGLLIHTSCGTLSAFGGPFTNRSGCSE